MPKCKARITYESDKILFGDNKHYFYPEYQCQNSVVSGDLCKVCSVKSNTTKTQEARCFDHGLIDGPFTAKSHIVGSPWYLKMVNIYGKPKDPTPSQSMPGPVKKGRRIKKGLRIGNVTETVCEKQITDLNTGAYEIYEEPLPVTAIEECVVRIMEYDGKKVLIDDENNMFSWDPVSKTCTGYLGPLT